MHYYNGDIVQPGFKKGVERMPLQPITKTRLSEAAIEQIKGLIVSENLEPGTKLPSERKLVEALGVGRSSIREALRILEIMGLVEVLPGKGAFVKALTGDLFIPLSDMVSDHKKSPCNTILRPAWCWNRPLRHWPPRERLPAR